MIFKDSPLANSNISDLINDLLRNRKGNNDPFGWQVLANYLSEMNIPHELIGNLNRLKYMKKKDMKPPGSPAMEKVAGPSHRRG